MSQPPHIQRIVPCECGSSEAYWHGPPEGIRVYCCNVCWVAKKARGDCDDAVDALTIEGEEGHEE